jgi:DNA repair exonuclease SbcCD nuclease subunit
MRIAITADWHYDDYPNLVSAMKGSVSSRAADISKAINWIGNTCKENKVDELMVLGDLPHKRDLISVPIYNMLVNDIQTLSLNQPIKIVVGNHDQTTKGGKDNSLQPLSKIKNVGVYKNICTDDFRYYLPYREKYTELWTHGVPESYILFGHMGIAGARMSGFENAKSAETTAEELHLEEVIAGFFGHYHIHQQIAKRAWYVGAPLQHSFRDVNNKCGFMVVDIDEDGKLVETEFIENTFSPKFHIVDVSKDDPRKYPATDFIRLRNATNEDLVDLISLPNIIGIDREEIQEQSERSYLSLGEDSLVLADKWVDNNCNDPRRARRLKEIGKDILRKVME